MLAALRVAAGGCAPSIGADRGPVAGRAAPAPWIGLARLLVQGMAGGEDGAVSAGMALRRGDVADTAVMMVIVPEHEGGGPFARGREIGKAPARELRAVLGGAEQRL